MLRQRSKNNLFIYLSLESWVAGERWGDLRLGAIARSGATDPTWSEELIGNATASFLDPVLNPFKDKPSGREENLTSAD